MVYPLVAVWLILTGCIKNDLPYPKIFQNIRAISAEGESSPALIDSVTQEVWIYLDEVTDIQKVKFTKFEISEGGSANPDLLEGVYDLSSPLFVTLSLYQEYTWEIKGEQEIERYFEVDGEVGASIVDPVAKRVVVHMPEGTDLSTLKLLRAKLGPKEIATYIPALNPGPLNLEYPLQIAVTAWGRTEIWTIYAEISETMVSTTQVDAWAKVIWAYGVGPSDGKNGFQYRKSGDTEWINVPEEYLTGSQGVFSCYIPHLETLTDYEVRTISGEDVGNVIKVTTSATELIPNGDFEDWSKNSKGMWQPWAEGTDPYWGTGNTGTITLGMNNTEPSDHTPPGITGKSVQMITRFVGLGVVGKLGAGSIFTGTFRALDGMNGILDFGRPWTLRPTKLKGYYQYKSVPIDYASEEFRSIKGLPDTCQIYVALTDWTAPFEIRNNPKNRHLFDKNADYVIAYGELISGDVMEDFKPFEIELQYRSTSRVPSYIQITCTGSKYGDYYTGGNGSQFWVDQFTFDWDY